MAADSVCHTGHANFGWIKCQLYYPPNRHPHNLSHTQFSKFSCYPTKLTNVYQLNGAKADLQTARFFELEVGSTQGG
jgi:hypothetical protein